MISGLGRLIRMEQVSQAVKRILILIILLAMVGFACAETIEEEDENGNLRITIRRYFPMVQVTVPKDLKIYQDENDPTEVGDIKLVSTSATELDDCDAITQWSVHSGAGVTVTLDNADVHEGTGSVKVFIPAGVTAIVKATKSSGSWDLSSHKYLKAWLKPSRGTLTSMYLHFGESAYDEQSTASFSMSANGAFQVKAWDISAIAAASRDGVTLFSIQATNGGSSPIYLNIDYVISDSGYSSIKAKDTDRVIQLYPKIFVGTYDGDGNDNKQIAIPRMGVPNVVRVMALQNTYPEVVKITGMASARSKATDGTYLASDGIKSMADGYFTLGTNVWVNEAGKDYYFMVFWQD